MNDYLRDAWKYYEYGRLYNNNLTPNQYTMVNTNNEFFIGNQWIHMPDNEAFRPLLQLDEAGYAASGEDCLTETAGLFVAGDCRTKTVRQVTTAAADGAVAALAACHYLDA